MDASYSWIRRSVNKLKNTSLPFTAATTTTAGGGDTSSKYTRDEEEAEKLYGITEQLVEFIKSFSLDTFNNFSLPEEEQGISGDGGSLGNLRQDLSDWQETHAMLVLSKVKELSQLRFQLCPRRMKERQFWRVYFKLVRSYVLQCFTTGVHQLWNCCGTGYELRAVQLAKLKQISMENETVSNSTAYEVEMSEAKFTSMES